MGIRTRWFELCPLNVNINSDMDSDSDSGRFCKIPWDMEHDKRSDGRYVITINVRLSEMLARLRGFVQVYKRKEEAAEGIQLLLECNMQNKEIALQWYTS